MNQPRLKEKWGEYAGHARARWGGLTEDDLAWIAGDRDRLVELVQRLYRRSRDQAQQEVEEWERNLDREVAAAASARVRIADAANPIDTGERGPTGPASI